MGSVNRFAQIDVIQLAAFPLREFLIQRLKDLLPAMIVGSID
jgi:hypothetical protein